MNPCRGYRRKTILLSFLWMMTIVLVSRTSCTFATNVSSSSSESGDGKSIASSRPLPWEKATQAKSENPFFVVATGDGSVIILNAQTGSLVQTFPSGLALVGPSSTLASGRRIVPGLDGRLYVTTLPEEAASESDDSDDSEDTSSNLLQPLDITVLDVLQSPAKTCTHDRQNKPTNDCGIVTATKSTSLFALDAMSGQLMWHQFPNGTTIRHRPPSHPESATVILQREDIMVQQLSTDSGLSVWNVTLGTFDGLLFDGDSPHQGGGPPQAEGDDSFLPGQQHQDRRAKTSSTSRNILLQPPPHSQPAAANTETLLPSIMFGPDGTTLTAVDANGRTSLWNLEFPTGIASVLGLNGNSWKPLTVLEAPSKTEPESTMHKALEQGDTGTSTSMTLFRPPSFDQMFVQNERYLEHLDWLYQESKLQTLYYQQHHSPFPPIPESVQSRRHSLPNFLIYDSPYGGLITNNDREQLALPGPNDGVHPKLLNPDIRSDGLFLTWPVLVAILCLAVTILQRWYKRKKRQWYQDFEAKAELNLTATSVDVTQGFIESEDPGSKPLRFLMHNQRTVSLKRALSVPGVDQPPPGPPQVQNVSMTWVHPPPDVNGEVPPDIASPVNLNDPQPAANPIVTSPTLLPVDKPQQEQGIGFLMNGIPLIRYPRYESEFKEITALGKGGFGTVFQVQNVLDGREYAIKKVILKSDSKLSQDKFQQQLQRTLREVKSLALLDHPNIVRYYTAWLELDNNTDDALVDPAAGASDYYLYSPTDVSTMNEKALGKVSSISNRYASWRRPSLENLRKMTDFNPLSGWKNTAEDDDMFFNDNIAGVPAELDDYGFTFERSENAESIVSVGQKEQRNEKNCTALVKYPVSVQEETSRKGFFSRRSSVDSFASSVDESQSTWSKESGNQSIPLLKNHSRESKKEEEAGGATTSVKHLLYIQMQYCSQKTLADFLCNEEARKGPTGGDCVDIPYALSLFLQIAQGVKHVHTQGAVKVGDFGLSRESGESRDEGAVVDQDEIEGAGDITAGVGTRSYASPEQMDGSDYDASTDVFSLGIILFELCYPMYTGMERYIVMSKLRKHIFPDQWVASIKPTFPGLHSLLLSMISHNPADRPTAQVVAERIQSILSGLTVSSLDQKHQYEGATLLRIEAKPREDVLRHTIQLLKEAAEPASVDIIQYGLRGGTNEAIMEFAIGLSGKDTDSASSLVDILLARMSDCPEIVLIRQVSATKYN
eukprot:scaffold7161_cov133-Cylindrotheca_fusiformis.AAC.10